MPAEKEVPEPTVPETTKTIKSDGKTSGDHEVKTVDKDGEEESITGYICRLLLLAFFAILIVVLLLNSGDTGQDANLLSESSKSSIE